MIKKLINRVAPTTVIKFSLSRDLLFSYYIIYCYRIVFSVDLKLIYCMVSVLNVLFFCVFLWTNKYFLFQ